MMSAASTKFWELCSVADDKLEGVEDIRASLNDVFIFVTSMPDAREEFVGCFRELLCGRGPWEVAYFCMRRLRWPEVYDAALELLKASEDFRIKTVMAHVLDAYTNKRDFDYLF